MVSWYGSIEAVLYIQGKVFRIPHSSVEEARSFSSAASDLLSLSTSKKRRKRSSLSFSLLITSGTGGEEKGWLRHPLVFVLDAFCWTKSLLCNVAAFTGMLLYPESTLQLCSSRRFYEVFKEVYFGSLSAVRTMWYSVRTLISV